MKCKLFIYALLVSFSASALVTEGVSALGTYEPMSVRQDRDPEAKRPNAKPTPKRPSPQRSTSTSNRSQSKASTKKTPKVTPNSFRKGSSEQDNALRAQKEAKLMSYSKLRKRAEKQVGGKVLSQQLVRTNRNGWVYQLRMRQNDGRIKSVLVDAKTGKVLSAQ